MVNNKITEISPKMVLTVKARIKIFRFRTDLQILSVQGMDFVLFPVSLCVSWIATLIWDHANHGVESVILGKTWRNYCHQLMLVLPKQITASQTRSDLSDLSEICSLFPKNLQLR